MGRMTDLMKRYLKKIAEPRGHVGVSNRIPLLLWESYAIVRGGSNPLKRRASIGKASAPSRDRKPSDTRMEFSSDFCLNHIVEHLLPFWRKHSIDHRHGGFITHLDRSGQIYDVAAKSSAMQARMIYGFAIGHEIQPDSDHLSVARQGVKFLLENLWDHEFGGWYQSVYRDGRVRNPEKNVFDQAYVLIGLLEYYRVSRNESTFNHILRTYELLDQYAWDKEYLGYLEVCHHDWAVKSSRKTICIQLDMLAAAMSLYEVADNDRYLCRLKQIADTIVSHMCDKKYGCVLEKFYRDWRYDPVATRDRVQIGHNLKGAWLLLRMYGLTRDRTYYTNAKRMIDYCIRYGWDGQNSGFYQHVYRNGILASSEKIWWPECEGIPALLLMHGLTHDPSYFDYFIRLSDFCFTYFFDNEHNEWFTSCKADGTVRDEHKGGDWKAAYHTVQACFESYRYLKERDSG